MTSSEAEIKSGLPMKTVALAGNPNVGKSSLFNQLTGLRQKIANYPGVTVEKKTGTWRDASGHEALIVDLPGSYSLSAVSEDEMIAARCLQGKLEGVPRPDLVLVVIEATNLSRGLFLFKQIQAMHPQSVLVLNMMDELKKTGRAIDVDRLSKLLGVPVVETCATTGYGLDKLGREIALAPHFPESLAESFGNATKTPEELFAEIDAIIAKVSIQENVSIKDTTEKWDAVFLHPVLGPFVFLAVMFLVFQALFSWSAPLMDLIDNGLSVVGENLADLFPIQWIKSLVADGIVAGVGSVVVFVPQIAIAFLLIGFLEMTGYLARGAFLIDRLMRVVGLEGRSFIPLFSSFACAVPGIMAARTVPDSRQRLMTILVAPLMSCSARLPVYTLLIASFVPDVKWGGLIGLPGLVLFSLFLLGIFAGMAVSFILDKALPRATRGGFFIELPRYRLPTLKNLYYYVSFRVKAFLKTAGTVIFFLSIVLWALAYFPRDHAVENFYANERDNIEKSSMLKEEQAKLLEEIDHREAGELLRHSAMGQMGKFIEPALAPMGFDWRMGIGILASFAAREVFVSTMGIVFNLGEADESSQGLRALLANQKKPDGSSLYTLRTAMALLVFFALAAQCMSTLAVIRRETNSWKWPAFVFVYMSLLAYFASILVYQGMGFLGFT